ncbi:MAG: hypothetical protein MUQ92_02555 [Oceanospirillaceae bacterium]|nr:hypothetical protein [Oceanospirillaceae bacterium]
MAKIAGLPRPTNCL